MQDIIKIVRLLLAAVSINGTWLRVLHGQDVDKSLLTQTSTNYCWGVQVYNHKFWSMDGQIWSTAYIEQQMVDKLNFHQLAL